jgi:hypothetical protein
LAEILPRGTEKTQIPALARPVEQKMAALQAAYPQDDEAAIFHALTLGHHRA